MKSFDCSSPIRPGKPIENKQRVGESSGDVVLKLSYVKREDLKSRLNRQSDKMPLTLDVDLEASILPKNQSKRQKTTTKGLIVQQKKATPWGGVSEEEESLPVLSPHMASPPDEGQIPEVYLHNGGTQQRFESGEETFRVLWQWFTRRRSPASWCRNSTSAQRRYFQWIFTLQAPAGLNDQLRC